MGVLEDGPQQCMAIHLKNTKPTNFHQTFSRGVQTLKKNRKLATEIRTFANKLAHVLSHFWSKNTFGLHQCISSSKYMLRYMFFCQCPTSSPPPPPKKKVWTSDIIKIMLEMYCIFCNILLKDPGRKYVKISISSVMS